jgi:hypothetical protein
LTFSFIFATFHSNKKGYPGNNGVIRIVFTYFFAWTLKIYGWYQFLLFPEPAFLDISHEVRREAGSAEKRQTKPQEKPMAATSLESIRQKLDEQHARESGQLCPKAVEFKKLVTDLIGAVAEQRTKPEQLDEALSVLNDMAAEWRQQARGLQCSVYSHPCVEHVCLEARLRLTALKRLQLKQKLW